MEDGGEDGMSEEDGVLHYYTLLVLVVLVAPKQANSVERLKRNK